MPRPAAPPVPDAPRVRVVVVNYGGGDLTLTCLRSVLATDWPADRLEVVLVDNASNDGVVDRVGAELPAVVVVASPVNSGFAGGCNLGARVPGRWDLLALVNNDAIVEPGWLQPLVAAVDPAARVGAACPKMLLADRYLEARVDVPAARPVDGRTIGVEVTAARIDGERRDDDLGFDEGFFPAGTPAVGDELARWSWRTGAVRVRVAWAARPPSRLALRLRAAVEGTAVSVRSAVDSHDAVVGASTPTWVEVGVGGAPFDVINSAGAALYPGGFSGDHGFLERDDGQYDTPREVFGFSGGAVVLARELVDDVGLFDERLFLYYEDTDLAWRGRRRGWRYLYVPAAVVRHSHAASTVEGSSVFRYHNERNRPLVLAKNAPAVLAARAGLGVLGRAMTGTSAERRVAVGYLRLLPAMLVSRWRRHEPVRRRAVMRWVETKDTAR
jgi:GT2 family glycosyltransferase